MGDARLGLQDARRRQALARRQADDGRRARGVVDLVPFRRRRPDVDPRLFATGGTARPDAKRRPKLGGRSALALRLSTNPALVTFPNTGPAGAVFRRGSF